MNEILEFSPVVIPVVDCSKEEIEIVSRAIKKAVPYLESLMSLRYYPVPTYIVDEYPIDNEIEVSDGIYEDEDLKQALLELSRFLESVCLTFHKCSFNIGDNERGKIHDTNYEEFSKLSDESREYLRRNSEGFCWYLCELVEGRLDNWESANLENLYYIKGISSKVDFITNFLDDLYEIQTIFKNMAKKYTSDRFISDEYFSRRDSKENINTMLLKKWLTKEEYEILYNCIFRNNFGEFQCKKDLNSVAAVMDVYLSVLRRLLKLFNMQKSKYHRISMRMHTFGVYSHKDSNSKQLQEKLQQNGYPSRFLNSDNGKVILCIDRIKERVFRNLNQLNQTDNEEKELLEKLITATIIHEHAHAATFEGVGEDIFNKYYFSRNNSGKQYKLVCESLAEWAELNYFRDDKEMFDIIYDHVNYDGIKDWPYAGARMFEENYDLMRYSKYRAVLNYFRKNTSEAYKLLKA